MSRIIDSSGALAQVPASAQRGWRTIYSERGTRNRYNPPTLNEADWRNRVFDRIKINWFFANNGVRLYSPAGGTKIAGTILITNNFPNQWEISLSNTTNVVIPYTSSLEGAGRVPYSYFIAGEIDLLRVDSGGYGGVIKADAPRATFNGMIHLDAGTASCVPLFTQDAVQFMSLDIAGYKA
jgi:hypothetical protein